MNNKDFFQALKTTNINYLLCDLHVHSIASADILNSERYEQLNDKEKELITSLQIEPRNYKDKWEEYDQLVAQTIKPEDYLSLIVERRDRIASSYDLSEGGKDWSIIAITDHNSCKFSCKISDYACHNKNTHRIIVLPGIELEIEFAVEKGVETPKAHICLIFPPCTSESQIHTSINQSIKEQIPDANWDFGQTIQINQLSIFISHLRNQSPISAICIAAHISSKKGVREEALKVLTTAEAEYIRLSAEYEEHKEKDSSYIQSHSGKEIKRKLDNLQIIIGGDDKHIKVLKLIGACGFDALQVSNREDDIHYKCLHRFEKNFGRAVTILCSDAHRVDDIFNCGGDYIPYIKFPSFKSSTEANILFNRLKEYSLRFGETRFSSIPISRTTCYIKGIEISKEDSDAKQFWPFNGNSKFTIPFSPNLNCLIGGRGAGKSAMIEALAFLLSPDEYKQQAANKKQSEQKDWYKRARNTLSGCNVKICWNSRKEGFANLEKASLFLNRYFNPDQRYEDADKRDLEGNQVVNDTILSSCKAQLYRMSDLEELASDDGKMRQLFDSICEGDIGELESRIKLVLSKLNNQKEDIKKTCKKLAEITKDASPLRTYITRKKQYDDVNTTVIKTKCDKLDQATAAKQIAQNAKNSWDEITSQINIKRLHEDASQYFDDIDRNTKDEKENIVPNTDSLRKALFDKEGEQNSLKDDLLNNVKQLDTSVSKTSAAIESAQTSISAIEQSERDSLEKDGLPTGSRQREAKKKDFESAEQAIAEYRTQIKRLGDFIRQRNKLFGELKQLAQKRTSLREATAKKITAELKRDLDSTVLVIEADARPMADKEKFISWLDDNLFPLKTQSKDKRIQQLLNAGLFPNKLHKILIEKKSPNNLVVSRVSKSAEGRIDKTDAEAYVKHVRICYKSDFEDEIKEQGVNRDELPNEIKKGIKVFVEDQNKIEAFLQLDEILFDDIPEIRLKDRPEEMKDARPINELSPGQRCSAILPIILLNGDCPLIIDQPEDNLDNRLIREVVVNILAAMKLRRQVIMATHNPNLPVLGDVEQAIILRATEQDRCQLQVQGDIDNPNVVRSITEIMEGGREAFQYRHSIYQTHWNSPVEEPIKVKKDDNE